MSDKTRLEDVKRFYEILRKLECRLGGRRILTECTHSSGWPTQGVYFFMENSEKRSESGEGLRIVRVGASTSLWSRLYAHKNGSSVFRRLIGSALINKQGIDYAYYKWWSQKTSEKDPAMEKSIKRCVSKTIGKMPFLWLKVDNAYLQSYIEGNATALLSNFWRKTIDAPSATWLGYHCTDKQGNLIYKIKESGLWSQDFVEMGYPPEFLDKLEELVEQMEVVR